MATMFENMGNYSFATGYASLRHMYTQNVEDLARCVDDSIMSRNNRNIITFCTRFTGDDDFEEYCQKRSAGGEADYDYKQYVLGNLASAKYAEGDKEGALSDARNALSGVTGFPVNNAAGILAIRVAEAADGETAKALLEIVRSRTPEASQQQYFDAVVEVLTF